MPSTLSHASAPRAVAAVGTSSARAPRSSGAWLPWNGPGRPASAAEERRFVVRLTDLAEQVTSEAFDPDGTGWTRRDVTAVVTALRCGLSADELLERAPGLVPGRLVAAHRAVEALRRGSERAWNQLVGEPNHVRLVELGPAVAALLPVVAARLVEQARHGAAQLARAVASEAEQVARVGGIARDVEAWVVSDSATPGAGDLLYGDGEPGLWDHDHFLPPRVGALVPSRLAALLGERSAGGR